MAKSKRSGAAHKGYYANYKASKRWETNRKRKLERALKLNPGNAEQITTAMKAMVYRRQTPKTRVWSSTMRRAAAIFKAAAGWVPREVLSGVLPAGKDAQVVYWKTLNTNKGETVKLPAPKKSMFSIGERLQSWTS